MTEGSPVIETRGLSKRYRRVTALREGLRRTLQALRREPAVRAGEV